MIYFGYGMWNSSLELSAREEEAHASSYQRYDAEVDESLAVDDDLHPQEDEEGGRYQGWAGEERGYQNQIQNQSQNQDQYQDHDQYQNYQQQGDEHRTSTRGQKSRGTRSKGFEELLNED